MNILAYSIDGTPVQVPGEVPTNGGFLGQNLISLALELLLSSAVVLCLFYLILGGISWITSGGDKHGIEVARARLIYAGIGLGLVFMSFFIIKVIGAVFGIDLLALPTS